MPVYEGLVESIHESGAKVVIRPDNQCIPGAPGVSKRVCHCASDGSTLRIEALNRVDAGEGDWVSVSAKPSALMKKAATLLGIPMLGLLLGIVVALVITQGFTLQSTAGGIVVAGGLLMGVIMGVMTFRRVSDGYQPVIDRIIEPRMTAPSLFEKDKSPSDCFEGGLLHSKSEK